MHAILCKTSKENGIRLTTSNGESADLVAKGEMDFGLVDSDDAVNRMRQGKPATDLGTERERPWGRRPIGLAAMSLGG